MCTVFLRDFRHIYMYIYIVCKLKLKLTESKLTAKKELCSFERFVKKNWFGLLSKKRRWGKRAYVDLVVVWLVIDKTLKNDLEMEDQ